MNKVKHVLWIVLLVIGAIVILQNTAAVETRLLFWSIVMPRAVLLFITALVGYALGALTMLSLCKREKK